jgi:hypothetical protein
MKRIIWEATGVFADGFDLSKRVRKRFKRECVFLATARTFEKMVITLFKIKHDE